MNYGFTHANLTVTDLNRSLKFYDEALNLKEVSRREFDDCFMVYLRGHNQNFELELRVNKNPVKKINLGDNPTHLALASRYELRCLRFGRFRNLFYPRPRRLQLGNRFKKFLR